MLCPASSTSLSPLPEHAPERARPHALARSTAAVATRPLALILTALLVLAGALAMANPALARPADPASQDLHELTADDADAWLDGMVPSLLQHGSVSGAAVSIIKDGQLLTARGYGSADSWHPSVEGATAVDPETTLFRTGSISKVFTAVAAMQLVERGKLDLDGGVQQYIDVELDLSKGEPTVRQLMTHTAGFEEYIGEDFMQSDPERFPELREVIEDMPRQIYQPGTVSAYSNHGTALLGYIVEQVSGEPYSQYVDTHVLEPLGMTHSTLAQPLPDELTEQAAAGFHDPAADPAPQPFELIAVGPAGAQSSTATDMAAFASFLLGHGPDGVLSPESLELMQQPAIDADTAPLHEGASSTMGLQLWLGEINGTPMVSHGGDTGLFHSQLTVFPEQDLGIFISQNGLGTESIGDVRSVLVQQFADRYVAARPEAPAAIDGAAEHAQQLAGTYALSRQQRSGALKIGSVMGAMRVTANDDGTVSLEGSPAKYRETAPGVWTLCEGEPYMPGAEQFTARGDAIGLLPAHELHRVPMHETRLVFLLALGTAVLIGVFTMIAGIAGAVGRVRDRRDPARPDPAPLRRSSRWARRLVPLVGVGMLVAIAGYGGFLSSMSVLQPSTLALRIAQIGLLLTAVGGASAGWRLWEALRGRSWWRVAGLTLVIVAAATMIGIGAYYNLGTVNIRF